MVKIDRSIINKSGHDPRRQTLVKAMISMTHDLGYSVVAEGVETLEGHQYLKAAGCDEVQGYLHSRPLDVTSFEQWLNQSQVVEAVDL